MQAPQYLCSLIWALKNGRRDLFIKSSFGRTISDFLRNINDFVKWKKERTKLISWGNFLIIKIAIREEKDLN